jgi:hypothetical protein
MSWNRCTLTPLSAVCAVLTHSFYVFKAVFSSVERLEMGISAHFHFLTVTAFAQLAMLLRIRGSTVLFILLT